MATRSPRRRNTELAFTFLAVALVLVGAGVASYGTWAYFTDTDASDPNTIESGTMDITLDGINDGVSGSFTLINASPTDTTSQNFAIRNVGSVSADHVEINISATENDTRTEPADSDLNRELNASETAQHIEVTTFEYQNDSGTVLTDFLSSVTDTNGNGIVDLDEVITQAGVADDLAAPLPNSGNTTHLVITVEIANDDDGSFTGTDEDIMADGIDVRIEFTLNQDSSQ